MNKKQKSAVLNFLGIFFLAIGLLAMANSFIRRDPFQVLYFCYIGLVLIGVGTLTRKSYIIMSQVYILAIPLIIWGIDFLHYLIFRSPLWGITDYFFQNLHFLPDRLITLQHLFTIPLAIYAASLIGVKRKDAWEWSIVQITILYFVIFLFSPPQLNINCVFTSCVNFISISSAGLYSFLWFLAAISMILISAFTINKLPFLNK